MTAAQRTALLALLDGIWDDPDACVYADTQEEYDFIKEPFPAAGGTPSAASAAAPRQRAVAEVRPAAVAAPAGPAVNTARDAAEIQALIAACSRCGQQQERKMPFGAAKMVCSSS
jgi:hypothetical protein